MLLRTQHACIQHMASERATRSVYAHKNLTRGINMHIMHLPNLSYVVQHHDMSGLLRGDSVCRRGIQCHSIRLNMCHMVNT